MTKTNNKKTAFSIVELSFVILVISLTVISVLAAKQLFLYAALAKAQSLTSSSSVGGIEDLAMWYETTSEKSFLTSEVVSGGTISQWNDINRRMQIRKDLTDQTAGTTTDRPTYTENAINGLPALSFDGTADFLARANTYAYEFTTGSEATVFVVSKAISPVQMGAIFYWHSSGNNYFNVLAPWNDSIIYWDLGNCCGPDGRLSITMPSNFMDRWNIASYITRLDGSAEIYVNGLSIASASSGTMTLSLPLTDSATFYLGSYNGANFFKGYIAEVIIYSRALSYDERLQVTSYLSRKWDIDVK